MNRSIIFVLAFFSLQGFSFIDPHSLLHQDPQGLYSANAGDRLTGFNEGSYLGEGRYVASNGATGNYSVLADIGDDFWQLSYIRYGKLSTFRLKIDFNSLGFFIALAEEQKTEGEEKSYSGRGYCASAQCHLTLDLGDEFLEETITFDPKKDRIYRLGSMSFTDQKGHRQMLTWEERLFKLPHASPSVNELAPW